VEESQVNMKQNIRERISKFQVEDALNSLAKNIQGQ